MALSNPAALPRLLALVLLALLPSACASTTGSGETPLRVLVYNIFAGKDTAGVNNLERVAQNVRDTRADLVLLQEVDRGTVRSGGEDQLATLERLTGFHGAFGKTLDYQGGDYGIAVLARWPIREHRLNRLPVTPAQHRGGGRYEPRGALHARIHAPFGTIHLVNTHLDAARDDHYRLQEVATLSALADSLRRDGGLVLVGGDLNDRPGTVVVRRAAAGGWRDAWPGCGEGDGFTFPSHAPDRRIDYLLVPTAVRCDSAAVLVTLASDHRPILFVLTVGAGGSD